MRQVEAFRTVGAAPRLPLHGALKLAAGGEDVAAARLANVGGDSLADQNS